MTKDNFIEVPTYDNGEWTKTTFKTRESFLSFLKPLFKEPGKYEFDETSFLFNEEARKFNKQGYYCSYPEMTKDYINYWDTQKERCTKGVIYKNKGKTWYIARDYYMWLNFLPIVNKEKGYIITFPDFRDGQYHVALYNLLAELQFKNSVILKKRQFAMSYYHCAKLINSLWFDEGVVLKMGAAYKGFIDESTNWKFLTEYKNFLDRHTAWRRPMNPYKIHLWQQQIEVNRNGVKSLEGLKGTLKGLVLEDPTNGVSGPCKYFIHDESGIAPKMNITFEYLEPSLRSGEMITGMFIALGSVGDLDQCKPLKDMIFNPHKYRILAVETNLFDEKGTVKECGLFIPEHWSMPPYIDEYGNSKIEEALEAIKKERYNWKYGEEKLSPEQYQLRISQRPINISEAFAFRGMSPFPQHLIRKQRMKIENGDYPVQFYDITRDEKEKPVFIKSNKLPIRDFPVKSDMEDKTGIIEVWELPDKSLPWGTYFASVDPVGDGKSTSSKSLFSIYIYKNAINKIKETEKGNESWIEYGKIVACWHGRFDNLRETHERALLLIEAYNAWTIVESNVSIFIQYVIEKGKQRYLVPKDQIVFLKDLKSNLNTYQEYGWKNTGRIFKDHLLNYGIEFLKEKLDQETKPDGEVVKTLYGIERIPDIMLITEMEQYEENGNYDRLISFCALAAFVCVQDSNLGIKRVRVQDENKNLQNKEKISIFNRSPFVNIGKNKMSIKRQMFKNFR